MYCKTISTIGTKNISFVDMKKNKEKPTVWHEFCPPGSTRGPYTRTPANTYLRNCDAYCVRVYESRAFHYCIHIYIYFFFLLVSFSFWYDNEAAKLERAMRCTVPVCKRKSAPSRNGVVNVSIRRVSKRRERASSFSLAFKRVGNSDIQ